MTAAAAVHTTEVAAHPGDELSRSGIAFLNPLTGLSTDYLNHFTEAAMVLEMASAMPECLADLRAWQPKTYVEHFATSRFKYRAEVIRAYHAADPAIRGALDVTADALNVVLLEARNAIVSHMEPATVRMLSERALDGVRPLIARLSAVINGDKPEAHGQIAAQAAIDVMFQR